VPMPNQLIVALDITGSSALAGPIVACAVAYLSDVDEPLFVVSDGKGNKSKMFFLRQPSNIPETYRKPLREELVRQSVGVAHAQRDALYIKEHGVEAARTKAANSAVVRLFERIANTRPDLAGMGLENILVLSTLEGRVEDLPPGIVYVHESGDRATLDWRLNAAGLLAAFRRREVMLAIAERYPQHGFEQHLGSATKAHKDIIRKVGLTPEHRESK
jgi:ribonuclease HII